MSTVISAAHPVSPSRTRSPIGSETRRVRRRAVMVAGASTAPAFQRRPHLGRPVTTPSPHVHIFCTPCTRHRRDTHRVSSTTLHVQAAADQRPTGNIVFELQDLSVDYGQSTAVRDVSFEIYEHAITAIIGPSGCGKSTVLRCLNRMNDLVSSAKVGGSVLYHGIDLYGKDVDPIEVRRRIGMVFQRPNPFPKSIYDNVAYGLRILGMKDDLDG